MDNTANTAPAAAEPSEVDKAIDLWHREHFAGVSTTTEMWNASFAAKEDLKKRIAKLL
jgi:hypothetical protein